MKSLACVVSMGCRERPSTTKTTSYSISAKVLGGDHRFLLIFRIAHALTRDMAPLQGKTNTSSEHLESVSGAQILSSLPQ